MLSSHMRASIWDGGIFLCVRRYGKLDFLFWQADPILVPFVGV